MKAKKQSGSVAAPVESNGHVETGWIQLYGDPLNQGPVKYFPGNVQAGLLRAVARGLAAENRYAGATTKVLYTVAQHSVLASCLVAQPFAKRVLFHDGPEGLGLKDFPRPYKETMPPAVREWYRGLDDKIMRSLALAYCFQLNDPACEAALDAVDQQLLVTESRDLFVRLHPDWHYQEANGFLAVPFRIEAWPWTMAEAMFLWAYVWHKGVEETTLSSNLAFSNMRQKAATLMDLISQDPRLGITDPQEKLISEALETTGVSVADVNVM